MSLQRRSKTDKETKGTRGVYSLRSKIIPRLVFFGFLGSRRIGTCSTYVAVIYLYKYSSLGRTVKLGLSIPTPRRPPRYNKEVW